MIGKIRTMELTIRPETILEYSGRAISIMTIRVTVNGRDFQEAKAIPEGAPVRAQVSD